MHNSATTAAKRKPLKEIGAEDVSGTGIST